MTVANLLLWPLAFLLTLAGASVLIEMADPKPQRVPARLRPRRRPF